MKLLILDGNSIINRAFYGVHLLSTRDGFYTNAIFGFLNILHRLQEEERPDALCVAFDLKGPTFRHEQYKEYKATRKGMPEELAEQLPVMKEVLAAMNIPVYTCQGWEADDVIGTVTKICCREGWQCVVATGDRDSLQLVNDCVTVRLAVMKAGQTYYARYTPQVFREEYGFEPKTLVDLKALMGDSSDNIPGVAGIGPKTAKELLWKFGSLDGVYENLESPEIRASVRKKLEDCADMARLSYDLATIRCCAPVEFSPEDALVQPVNKKELHALFLRLEFLKLMDRYGLLDVPQEESAEECRVCHLSQLPDPAAPCALAFDAAFENFAVATEQGTVLLSVMENRDYLESLLKTDAPKCCADLKTLYHFLRREQLPWESLDFDVSVASYLLDPSQGDYSMARLAVAYLSRQLREGDLEDAAAAILQLRGELERRLREEGIWEHYRTVEHPLAVALGDMEMNGILVDRKALVAFGKMLTERIDACQSRIFDCAGGEFNINSTKQLGELLFERLGLPPVKKTKTGYSTGAEVLEKLKPLHPIVADILDYRMLTKLNSTYAEGLLKVIGSDGRIHTTFQNTVTATGRLSSTDPNLQNIPVRTEMGSEIRKMFVPRPGWVLVDADYSQIELRVLSHIADDKAMQAAFCSGEDFHTAMAAQVFGVAIEDVTPEMRRNAKAVNFGVVYGISEFSLAEDLGISRAEAKGFIDAYLARFSGVAAYRKSIVEQARADGYITTLSGRRRYIPELQNKNHMLRMAGERIALNSPIQGTAADIMKIATVRVANAFRDAGLQARLLLQVHDELIAECPVGECEAVKTIIKKEMEQAACLAVPLTVEAHSGGSWYEAK